MSEEGYKPEDLLPGEPETRIKDVDEAQVMAQAGNYNRTVAARYHQESEETDNETIKGHRDQSAKEYEVSAERLELAAQKIHRHPEIVEAKRPLNPESESYNRSKTNEINPKILCEVEDSLTDYEEYNKEVEKMIKDVERNHIRNDYLYYYEQHLLYGDEEYDEYMKKNKDLWRSDDTTIGEIKKSFIDGVLKKIQSKLQKAIESHKEYLSKFD